MFVALTLASSLELRCLFFLSSTSLAPVRIEPKMGRCRLGQNAAAAVLLGLILWLKCAEGGGWEEKVKAGKEKVTRLHFYMHDQVTGKNATAVQVASAPSTKLSQTRFGEVSVIDDLLTEGPHPASKLVGRAQGFYSSADQNDVCLLMAFNIVLQGGEFNGSTLSVLGKNEVFNKVREMPIVGGSGAFRLARGYCLAQTHSLNLPDAVIRYNVTVFHY